jgi:hypothetical protein
MLLKQPCPIGTGDDELFSFSTGTRLPQMVGHPRAAASSIGIRPELVV